MAKLKKKYIDFEFVSHKTKTSVYKVKNLTSNLIIGYVYWYPQWRQYCFFPEPHTVYSSGCLNDIIEFIKTEMLIRRSNG